MFVSYIGAFYCGEKRRCVCTLEALWGEKKMCMYSGSSFMNYTSVMDFIEKMSSLMSLLTSNVFNDSCGV